jgi:hypothetical protein
MFKRKNRNFSSFVKLLRLARRKSLSERILCFREERKRKKTANKYTQYTLPCRAFVYPGDVGAEIKTKKESTVCSQRIHGYDLFSANFSSSEAFHRLERNVMRVVVV